MKRQRPDIFIDVLHNLGLLSFVTLVLFLIGVRSPFGLNRIEGKIFLGIIFAGMALLLVKTPVRIAEGATFDLHAAPAVLASFFGGPVAGLITASTAGIARYSVGGPAALGGAVSPFLYAGAGLFGAWAFRRTDRQEMGFTGFTLLGVVSTICVLPAFFIGLLPATGLAILGKLWPVLFGGNLIGIVVLGMLLQETQRVGRERIAFRNASVAAKEGLEAKNRFLSAISHDIRTPLNGIMGALQLLAGQTTSRADANLIRIAISSGHYLSELVDQILEFARLEAGEISFGRKIFTIDQVLDGIRSIFTEQAGQKGLSLSLDVSGAPDRPLEGDYDHLRQVLYNLVGNAIRFTDQGTVKVVARIEPVADENAGAAPGKTKITFSVIDTGIGISEADQKRIFERFYRSTETQSTRPGNGLGLSIAQGLVDGMGGHLQVESELGKGSRFSFTVEVDCAEKPAADASPVKTAPSTLEPLASEPLIYADVTDPRIENPAQATLPGTDAPEPGSKTISILVVDDNVLNRELMRAGLERLGYRTELADGGTAAIEAVRRNPSGFDVVLMDIQMPDLNGDEATKVIRQMLPDSQALPVIAVTANAFPDQIERYLQAGMNAVMTKPVNFDALRDALLRYTSTDTGTAGGAKAPESDEADAAGPEMPLIDTGRLNGLKTYLTDEKLLELLEATFDQIDEVIPKLRDAAQARDAGAIRAFAHNIKGMSANMGFSHLAHQASRTLESRTPSETAEAIDTLAGLLERTKRHLGETTV